MKPINRNIFLLFIMACLIGCGHSPVAPKIEKIDNKFTGPYPVPPENVDYFRDKIQFEVISIGFDKGYKYTLPDDKANFYSLQIKVKLINTSQSILTILTRVSVVLGTDDGVWQAKGGCVEGPYEPKETKEVIIFCTVTNNKDKTVSFDYIEKPLEVLFRVSDINLIFFPIW